MAVDNPDFFVSYNSADREWAEWIAWQLEEAGFTTVLQAWDFRPGSNFVVDMNRAAAAAKRTIAVLSPEYLGASFPEAEWAAAFAQDPQGLERILVPVRVRHCQPTGLLAQIVHIDLVGLDEEAARERLLEGIAERGKPFEAPTFPGGRPHAETEEPVFPGDTPAAAVVDGERPGMWVKLDDLVFAVDELDDYGDTISVKGRLDESVLRRLEKLRESRFGGADVRFVHWNRVVDGQLAALRRTTRAGATETEIRLERVEIARGSAIRAGTGGMSADDLIEAGLRHLLLGESLPSALAMLEFLADPGVNEVELAEAFRRPDAEAEQAVRLILADALIRHGHASAITRFELGPLSEGTRRVLLGWEEPRVHVNVEPQVRRLEGEWHLG